MIKRKIAVFTGNRAEYGLQFPVLKAIADRPELEYQLIVSGAHLDTAFGLTLEEIRRDGFEIHEQITCDLEEDTLHATARAIGRGIVSLSEALLRLRPDILVVYADRFEGFAAVIAGTQMRIATAHIEGGDITEGGALDDSVRHAMTKLSHLHFTTNMQATNRVLAMGEEPWRVHTVGFPAIDLIQEGNFSSSREIVECLDLDLSRPIVLFTQHSVTTEFDAATEQIKPSLEALSILASEGVQVIITYPNNDAGGRRIIAEIDSWAGENRQNIRMSMSLGRRRYHGVLALARNPNYRVACLGNSSSGIKETPAFGCPTVNIGSRQKGRLRAPNVIDVDYDCDELIEATKKCFYDDNFRQLCLAVENPYGLGDAGIKIAEILATTSLDQRLIQKRMELQGRSCHGWFR